MTTVGHPEARAGPGRVCGIARVDSRPFARPQTDMSTLDGCAQGDPMIIGTQTEKLFNLNRIEL